MTILEDLFYENINPNERGMKRDGQFDNLVKLLCRNEEKLTETLTESQKEMLEKVKDVQNEMYGISEKDAFIRGFIIAVKIMVQVMSTDESGEIL